MKVFITGGTGIIGRALVQRFLKSHQEVTVFQRTVGPHKDFNQNVMTEKGDLNDVESLRTIGESEGVLFHLAAITDEPTKDPLAIAKVIYINGMVPNIVSFFRSNSQASKDFPIICISSMVVFWAGEQRKGLIDESTDVDLKQRNTHAWLFIQKLVDYYKHTLLLALKTEKTSDRFVADISSIISAELEKGKESIFSDAQIYPYKIAKWVLESLVKDDSQATLVRFPSVYGPGNAHESRFLPQLVRSLVNNEKTCYPDVVRDFVYIDDVTEALFLLSQTENHGIKVLHVVSGKSISAQEVVAGIEAQDLAYRGVIDIKKNNIVQHMPPKFSNSKLVGLIKRRPLEFKIGIGLYIEWAKGYFFQKNV